MTQTNDSANPRVLDYQPRASARVSAVGHAAGRGMVWMTAQTILNKVVAFAGQIVLAWLLVPDDFALIAMAYTVSSIVNILQETGHRQFLINHQRRFNVWAAPAFWMSLTAGLINGIVMAAAAPIAARVYGRHELTGMILVLATWPPLTSLTVLPLARLQSAMRFRAFATVGSIVSMGTMLASVVFAWLGCGVYSFVLPWPLLAIVRAAVLWRLAPCRIPWRLHLSRWRYMLRTSGGIFVGRTCLTVVMQVDYIVLGLLYGHSDKSNTVGWYLFAFNLSLQAVVLLATNLEGIILPVLARYRDNPLAQRNSLLGAMRLLTIVGIPVCLLQAGLADASIHAMFQPKWYPAIAAVQALSIGMAFRLVTLPSQSLLQAQSRFRAFMWVNFAGMIIYSGLVTAGAFAGKRWLGAHITVAVAAAVALTIEGPMNLYIAIRPLGGSWRDVWKVHAAPAGVGALAVLAGVAAATIVPHSPVRYQWLRMAIILIVSAALYLGLIRVFSRESWTALTQRLAALRQPAAVAG